jgi:hypothetical protein
MLLSPSPSRARVRAGTLSQSQSLDHDDSLEAMRVIYSSAALGAGTALRDTVVVWVEVWWRYG